MDIKNAIKTVVILGTAYYAGQIVEHGRWQRATGFTTRHQAQFMLRNKKS